MEGFKQALYKIQDDIDAINELKHWTPGIPTAWVEKAANPALGRLRSLENDLLDVLRRHRESLSDSYLKRLAKEVLRALTSSQTNAGLSWEEAFHQEQKIMAEFGLKSDKILGQPLTLSSQHQSSVPTSSGILGSSVSTSFNQRSGDHLGSHPASNRIDQPFTSTHRGYEKSSVSTSRTPRDPYTDPRQTYTDPRQHRNSSQRAENNYYDPSIISDAPPSYHSRRSSQRHQSGGSVGFSQQWDHNSGRESIRSDVVSRGSHRSNPSEAMISRVPNLVAVHGCLPKAPVLVKSSIARKSHMGPWKI